MRRNLIMLPLLVLLACGEKPATPEEHTGEVPEQHLRANGELEYQFRHGCVVVMQPKRSWLRRSVRAVLRSESQQCQPHHRDIARLYATGNEAVSEKRQ
jgi:hypothetical protein